MSPKKKKNSKKPSLEDIVNKLSSLAKSQQEEKGKRDATLGCSKKSFLLNLSMALSLNMDIGNTNTIEKKLGL